MPFLAALEMLKLNWKPALAITIAFLWSLGCYNAGKRTIRAEWQQSIVEAKEKALQIEHDNAIFSNVIGGKYETGIKVIDDNFNSAINSLQSTSGDMPTKTNGTRKLDGKTCDNGLPQANKRKLLELAKQAEINTQRLISLQEWEKGVQ